MPAHGVNYAVRGVNYAVRGVNYAVRESPDPAHGVIGGLPGLETGGMTQ